MVCAFTIHTDLERSIRKVACDWPILHSARVAGDPHIRRRSTVIYRRIVEAKARQGFAQLNNGNARELVDGWAPTVRYHFVGDHALGGTRTDKETMVLWFERVFRVFPNTRFRFDELLVKGWPWRTTAVVFATLEATVDGLPYTNDFVQRIELRWGRVTSITTLEDTQRCAAALARAAAAGLDEAAAPPMDDTPKPAGTR